MVGESTLISLDGFVISQELHNQITADTLFGISKKDDTHLGHDDIKWVINSDIICNGCNICDSCQGDCHSSCQGTCTSGCQGSCHSSCQGGCTSKCQGCVGCHGGCTSKCNNGCYSGCTSKCVGCHSCNDCQTCVGSACNSANGQCYPSVHCIGGVTCSSCYITMDGCSPCVGFNGSGSGPVNTSTNSTSKPDVNPNTIPPSVISVTCSCFGCQNTVTGNKGCDDNYGYNTPVQIEVTYSDGTHGYITYKGEEIVEGGGSRNHMGDLADITRQILNQEGKTISENVNFIMKGEDGQITEAPWKVVQGATGYRSESCDATTGITVICTTCYGYNAPGTTGPGMGQAPQIGCNQGSRVIGSGCSSFAS